MFREWNANRLEGKTWDPEDGRTDVNEPRGQHGLDLDMIIISALSSTSSPPPLVAPPLGLGDD